MSAARPLRPRALAHRGTVEAAALLWDADWLPEAEVRTRLLSLWEPGDSVHALPGGWLLRLARPRRVDCTQVLGTPLTLEEGLLCTAPLAADERAALAAPPGSVVRISAGRAEAIALGPAVDVSLWLDVSGLRLVATTSLGEVPAAVVEVAPALEGLLRERFGPAVPPPSSEAQAFLAALAQRADGTNAPSGTARAASRPGFGIAILGVLASLVAGLAAAFRGASSPPPAGSARGPTGPASAAPPGVLSRLGLQLQQGLMRVLAWTRLGRVLGQRQARYLRKMFELFERGDLQEALRHAIPLDGPLSAQVGAMLGTPTARDSLALQPYAAGTSRVMLADHGLLAHMRQLYRNAFQRLEREGRIEEAAFVLAELLNANEEAVSFLERHGRLHLAAELAEGRGLPPGLVVRQWFLAGDVARAVAVARRHEAFADAVLRLERTRPEQARTLRLLWADARAEAGDWTGAVKTVWPVVEARHLAEAWIERGLEAGGTEAAQMLVHRVVLTPERFSQVREAAMRLLEDDGEEGFAARQAFAHALLAEETKSAALCVLARPAARALLRDVAAGRPISQGLVTKLAEAAGGGALAADLPSLPTPPRKVPLVVRPEVLRVELPAGRGAGVAVHDAAVLPDGRVLVALGEAGVRLLSREGRTLAHFDVPAHHLVVSDRGERAIAVAERGEKVKRLSRVDLGRRRAEAWCDAVLPVWAGSFDGNMWFAAADECLLAIDPNAPGLRTLWRVPDVGVVKGLARSTGRLQATLWGREGLVCWDYELPSFTLRARRALPETGRPPRAALPVPTGDVAGMDFEMDERGFYAWLWQPGRPLRQNVFSVLPSPWTRVSLGAVGPGLAAFVLEQDGPGRRVDVLDFAQGNARAELSHPGASQVRVRVSGGWLVSADELGRLCLVDLMAEGVRLLHV